MFVNNPSPLVAMHNLHQTALTLTVIFASIVSGAISLSISAVSADEPVMQVAGMAMWSVPAQAPHRILAQPQWLTPEQAKARDRKELLHPPVATIQAAVIDRNWRQPYAYGYFGATPHRHWQRHFGYQNAYTQWKFK